MASGGSFGPKRATVHHIPRKYEKIRAMGGVSINPLEGALSCGRRRPVLGFRAGDPHPSTSVCQNTKKAAEFFTLLSRKCIVPTCVCGATARPHMKASYIPVTSDTQKGKKTGKTSHFGVSATRKKEFLRKSLLHAEHAVSLAVVNSEKPSAQVPSLQVCSKSRAAQQPTHTHPVVQRAELSR